MVYRFLLFTFFVVTLLDPSGRLFGLKELLFCCTLLAGFIKYQDGRLEKWPMTIIAFVVLLFMPAGVLLGLYGDSNFTVSLMTCKALLFVLVLYLVAVDKEVFINCFMAASLVLVVVNLTVFFQYLFGVSGLVASFVSSGNVLLGPRQYGSLRIVMAFFKTSPILILTMGVTLHFWAQSKKLIYLVYSVIILFLLIVSGTRANMFASIFLFLLSIYFKIRKGLRLPVLILALSLSFFPLVSFLGKTLLVENEFSIGVKSGHAESYLEHFQTNPSILLFGEGFGKAFYSSGYNDIVYNSELTYFELVRYWGLLGTLLFLFLIARQLLEKGYPAILRIASLLFLLIAGSNPLLISSTGFLAIAVIQGMAKFSIKNSLKNRSALAYV